MDNAHGIKIILTSSGSQMPETIWLNAATGDVQVKPAVKRIVTPKQSPPTYHRPMKSLCSILPLQRQRNKRRPRWARVPQETHPYCRVYRPNSTESMTANTGSIFCGIFGKLATAIGSQKAPSKQKFRISTVSSDVHLEKLSLAPLQAPKLQSQKKNIVTSGTIAN